MRDLAKDGSGRKTSMVELLEELQDRVVRRGIVFVITDGFDNPDNVLKGLRHVRFRGHEVIFLHVLHRDEVDFPLDGNVRFLNLEGSDFLLARPHLPRPSTRIVGEFLKKLKRLRCGPDFHHVRMITDQPLGPALGNYLIRRRSLGRK
ncbi:MAG: hypothetical protein U0798_14350 [Gemmataceae bacterium]